MGNWPSSLRTELDESALEFYQHIDDPCLGTISIFTSHKLPFNYILRLERYVRHSQIYNLFQRIEYEGNPHLLNLFAFHI